MLTTGKHTDLEIIEDVKFRMGSAYFDNWNLDQLVPAQKGTLTVTKDSIIDAATRVLEARLKLFQSSSRELEVDVSTQFNVCLEDAPPPRCSPPVFFCKSGSKNNILGLAIDSRALVANGVFSSIKEDIPWTNKVDRCVWRGTASGKIGSWMRPDGTDKLTCGYGLALHH